MWFRHDLRLADNPALVSACERGKVHACFVNCPDQWEAHDVGPRRLHFLRETLTELMTDLAKLGIPMTIVEASDFKQVPGKLLELCSELGAKHVYINAEYPLNEQARDQACDKTLQKEQIELHTYHGNLVHPPGAVVTQNDTPYSVFTPFKRRWLTLTHADFLTPLPPPKPVGDAIEPTLSLTGMTEGGERLFLPGEKAAHKALSQFSAGAMTAYEKGRDLPGQAGTSKLSPYLAIGTLSPNQCLTAALKVNGNSLAEGSAASWINEIIWREFYKHVIALYPHVSMGHAFRRQYDALPWRQAPEDFKAWQLGMTGYPFVDAGMRQLAQEGWMHNRVRMVTAMFLSKHLLLDWRLGERHFMQQLVDGDFAANNGGWQWSASTGTDAAPYFRIFNPASQGKRFDPKGAYTRHYVPELAEVPDKFLYEPWQAGIEIDYPQPIVEHSFARERAIETFKGIVDSA